MDRSVNAPKEMADAITKTVYYSGSDAVCEGEPFVYTVTDGTASEYDGLRQNGVKRPTATGEIFAGVATRNYPAGDPGTGRLIEIATPGSKGVKIRVAAAQTQGAILQFAYATAGGKTFGKSGHTLTALAIGDAIVRQTVTAAGLAQADLAVAPYAAGVAEA